MVLEQLGVPKAGSLLSTSGTQVDEPEQGATRVKSALEMTPKMAVCAVRASRFRTGES